MEQSNKLAQYKEIIAENRLRAERSKYIIEFRLCVMPERRKTLITSFQHTVVAIKDKTIVTKGSVLKTTIINFAEELFAKSDEIELMKAIIENVLEKKTNLNAFTFQVYIITDTKLDEHSIGFTIIDITRNKVAEIIREKKVRRNIK